MPTQYIAGRQSIAWPTVAPISGANQESLSIRTGRSYARHCSSL